MSSGKCPYCVQERMLRAQAEGEAAGSGWAIQKAQRRVARAAQELSAVAAMLDTRLAARSDRTIAVLRIAPPIA